MENPLNISPKEFTNPGTTISAEAIHKYLHPKFNLERFREVVPTALEEGEKLLCLMSCFDKKGLIGKLITNVRGLRVADIVVDHKPYGEPKPPVGTIETTANNRLRQIR